MICTRCKNPVLTNFKWQQTEEFKAQPFCDRHCQAAHAMEHQAQKPIRTFGKSGFAAEARRYKG